jgi:hypothetical protein
MSILDPAYAVGLANWANAFAVAIVEPNGHTVAQVCPIIDSDDIHFGRERIRR